MEVFEEKPRVDRQASSASYHIGRNSKVKYILTMAGIILFTLALLIVIHFTREYNYLSREISVIQSENSVSEHLERKACEVPFCNTKECVFIASSMLESMNLNANPCSDFYNYACGGYSSTKAVPYGSDSYSPMKEAQEELLLDIRRTMEKPSTNNEDSAVGKMRRIYDSCVNATHRDEIENRTLSFWFSDIKLVPPHYVLGNPFDFEPPAPWTELLTNLEQYQIHTLFKPHFVATSNTAPEKLEVDCLVPFLNPETYYDNPDDELTFQLVMFKESMNAALEFLHMDRATRREFIEDVVKIERDIARSVSIDEPSPYPYLSAENKQLLRGIWQPVVGNAVQEMEVVSTCKYDMQTILTILNDAPNRSVVKYVMWRLLMQMMQYMGTEFNSLHLHYITKLPNLDYAYKSKSKECADVVRTELGPISLKVLFDNRFISKETINAVNFEFMARKKDMALIFSSALEGIDPSLANKFLDKLKSMKLTTGYLDSIHDDTVLDSLYKDMDIGDDYFSNILEMKRFKARRKFLRLWYQTGGNAANEISLDNTPLGTSSSYDYRTNTVHMDLGLFRPPIFMHSDEIPEYLTYGFLSILAREMARAFDTVGSYYDDKGQHLEQILWPSVMEQKYNDFLSCIRNQGTKLNINNNVNMATAGPLSERELPWILALLLSVPFRKTAEIEKNFGSEINDTQVLNNIIADIGSFFIPYEGLKTHLRSHMNEKPLPGIPLNKKQTFYVQTAQMFCEIRSKPAADPKSRFLLPPKLRVNAAISSMEDFGSVFNCPVKSSMVLENKCKLFNLLPTDL